MQGFKEYLTEARMAPLYHSTADYNLASIFKSNTLQGSKRRGNYGGFKFSKKDLDKNYNQIDVPDAKETKGVSLTRSYKTAFDWHGGIVLEFDQLKLTQNFKIVPINMAIIWGKGKNALGGTDRGSKFEQLYEEMIIGDMKNMSRYLTGIWTKTENSLDGDQFQWVKDHPLYKGVRKSDRF